MNFPMTAHEAIDKIREIQVRWDEARAGTPIVNEIALKLADEVERLEGLLKGIEAIEPPATLWFEEAGGYMTHEKQVNEILKKV